MTPGEFGDWTPLGAESLSGGGFEVAWREAGTDLVTAWNVSSSGGYFSGLVGALHAYSPA